MSILIKGMEMPIFEHQSWDIRKGADGKWYMVDTNAETSDGVWHEITLIPPHGRLIDADALAVHKFVGTEYNIPISDGVACYRRGWNDAIEAIMENAETIIG